MSLDIEEAIESRIKEFHKTLLRLKESKQKNTPKYQHVKYQAAELTKALHCIRNQRMSLVADFR